MEMNSIGSRDLSLTKYTLPTGEKRKVELTATSLFPEEEVRETEESQARYRKYEKIIRKDVFGQAADRGGNALSAPALPGSCGQGGADPAGD